MGGIKPLVFGWTASAVFIFIVLMIYAEINEQPKAHDGHWIVALIAALPITLMYLASAAGLLWE